MILNIGTGGLISKITVNTSAGATVTCVLSPFSYTATANASGVATFTVHKKGTWTCNATKNGASAGGTVSISANGENKTISLSLRKYLFKAGSGPTSSWVHYWRDNGSIYAPTNYDSAGITINNMSVGGVSNRTTGICTVNAIDFSGFKTLVISFSTISTTIDSGFVNIPRAGDIGVTAKRLIGSGTESYDITNHSGTDQIDFRANRVGYTITITDVWLEPV